MYYIYFFLIKLPLWVCTLGGFFGKWKLRRVKLDFGKLLNDDNTYSVLRLSVNRSVSKKIFKKDLKAFKKILSSIEGTSEEARLLAIHYAFSSMEWCRDGIEKLSGSNDVYVVIRYDQRSAITNLIRSEQIRSINTSFYVSYTPSELLRAWFIDSHGIICTGESEDRYGDMEPCEYHRGVDIKNESLTPSCKAGDECGGKIQNDPLASVKPKKRAKKAADLIDKMVKEKLSDV